MRIPKGPIWPKTAKSSKIYPELVGNLETEIVVIGGGITGLQTAYLLALKGKKVVLLEKDEVGEGATEYTTAFITSVVDTSYSDLVEMFGSKNAKLVFESNQKAIDFFEKIIKKEKIECRFVRCSSYQYANSEKEAEDLREEAEILDKLGIKVKFENNKLPFKNFGFLEFKNQAKFHPLLYLQALKKIIAKKGVKIFEKTEVIDIEEEKDGIDVVTKFGTVLGKYVIQATYAPIKEPLSFKLKKAMYTTYLLYTEIPKNSLPEDLYEDNQSPYHYFRVDKGKKFDYLLIGGEDHREELPIDPKKCFKSLEEYLKEILSFKFKIIRSWTGPILEPSDGLPLIGRLERGKNIYLATGFSGTGMTYSLIASQILSDLVLGRKNPYTKVYDCQRKLKPKQVIKKGIDYTKEFMGGAVKNIVSAV